MNMLGLSQFRHLRRRGMVLVFAVPLFVLAWHGVAVLRFSRADRMVNELISVMGFVANPTPDSRGTRLVVGRQTKRGWELYLVNLQTGQRTPFYEQQARAEAYDDAEFRASTWVLGWSPDDQLFAYCRNGRRELVIADGNSGGTVAALGSPQTMLSGAWLSPETIVCAGQDNALYEFRKYHDQWLRPHLVKCFERSSKQWKRDRAPIQDVTALSGTAVLWRQGGNVWCCNLDSETPEKIWESTATNQLLELSWVAKAQKLLVHGRDRSGEFLASFYPAKFWHQDRLEPIVRLKPDEALYHLMSFNDGKGCVYLTHKPFHWDTVTLAVQTNFDTPPVLLDWRDQVDGLAANQHQVCLTSCRGNEPRGVWEYDSLSGSLACVFPAREHSFQYVRNAVISEGAVTNAAGERLGYFMALPVNLSPGRKYPLVIDVPGMPRAGAFYFFQSTFWDRPMEAIANAGAFFLNVDRSGRSYGQWADDILSVYDVIRHDPQIDTNRVYLSGLSAGGGIVNRLLDLEPELWRGAIFMESVPEVNPTRLRARQFLIDGGGDDGQFNRQGLVRLRQWQDDAARMGIQVELTIHPHVGHIYRNGPVEKTRTKQLLLLLTGD
ncbi:MAG TPA: hypothetical protein VFB55_09160 [Verrucomicrobiae bacterium]|nr:hypothetical protein [Verrucomicrobiae bacterium]